MPDRELPYHRGQTMFDVNVSNKDKAVWDVLAPSATEVSSTETSISLNHIVFEVLDWHQVKRRQYQQWN